jgi:hypothetical protein
MEELELLDGINAKHCTCCGVLKPTEAFNKAKLGKLQRSAFCKVCISVKRAEKLPEINAAKKLYYNNNKEKINAKSQAWRDANPERCKENSRKWRKANTELAKEKSAKWYAENRESVSARAKAKYREDLEKSRAASRERAARNKQSISDYKKRYYEENSEFVKAQVKKYRAENTPKVNTWSSINRAAKLNRTPWWLTAKDKRDIEEFYHLARALTKATGIKYVVDHIIPLQGTNVSGLHVPSNLQILTESENSSKQNKFDIEEFNNGYS